MAAASAAPHARVRRELPRVSRALGKRDRLAACLWGQGEHTEEANNATVQPVECERGRIISHHVSARPD
jgi:hypothetical protein